MKKHFTFASDRRVHLMLCCSAAVLLSACGVGASDAGNDPQNQTSAQMVDSALTQSGAPAGADTGSSTVTPATDLIAPVAEATADSATAPAASATAEAASAAAALSENATDPAAPALADGASDGAGLVPAGDQTVLMASTVQGGITAPAATAVPACTYYIAPNGSDSGAGTLASPWKTIRFGSAKLTAGKTLCARGGIYYGQAGTIWRSSGTATAPVTLKNYPGEKPVFDGQWGDTGTGGDFLVFTNNSNVVVDGITAQHYADKYGNGTIDLHNGQGPVNNITIQNSTLVDNGSHGNQDHHIYLATGATNVTIRNNLFIRGAGSAIQAYHSPASSGIRIYNNVMIGGTLKCSQSRSNPCASTATQHWGLIIGDAKSTQIYNNTIYGMQYGMDFNYGTTVTGPFVVKNNLIVNSTVAGIRVASAYAPYYSSDYNGFYGNRSDFNWKGANMSAAQFASSTVNERHSIRANPLFVNGASGSYYLGAGSPMIDRGIAMTLFNTDKDGIARPTGGGTDIGAYEKH
jgi:hypothetical protein